MADQIEESQPGARTQGRRSVAGRLLLPPERLAAGAFLAGLAALAAAAIAVLSGSKLVPVGSNGAGQTSLVADAHQGSLPCQPGGTLPAGASAVRMPIAVNIGPEVTVRILAGANEERLITSGSLPAGWGISETVTVPIAPVSHAVHDVGVCVTFGPALGAIEVRAATMQEPVGGPLRRSPVIPVSYLRPGGGSWFSRLLEVARRMGLGGTLSGTWVALLELAIFLAAAGLALRTALRELGVSLPAGGDSPTRRTPSRLRAGAGVMRLRVGGAGRRALGRVPVAAWCCAAVAFLNAACWSLVSPPFQVPDEQAHFARTQLLAQAGRLSGASNGQWSEEEYVALRYLHHEYVRFSPEHEPIRSRAERDELESQIDRPLSRVGLGGAGVAAPEPPAYYAIEAVPYLIGSGGSILQRLALMRIVSALFAALTALFAYLFLREALPGSRWAWTAGALTVALAPLLGLMSGAVNPDSALCAIASASLFALARAFRRGLTVRRACALGALVVIGFATKLNFLGLAPGILLALALLAWRRARESRGEALRALLAGLSIALVPAMLYLIARSIAGRSVLGPFEAVLHPTGPGGSFGAEASYIWQFYLPRLPGMHTYFPGILPWKQIWFDRWVGLYGWLDTSFPVWVEDLAFMLAVFLAILALRALYVSRRALRGRLPELAAYAAMAIGMMILTGAASYREIGRRAGGYGEPRYLLPLVAALGLFAALAAKGAGRRLERAMGALMVVGVIGWDLFSQLQTIARFYG